MTKVIFLPVTNISFPLATSVFSLYILLKPPNPVNLDTTGTQKGDRFIFLIQNKSVPFFFLELRKRAPFKTKVNDVASLWGFWHMGQFAADYRKVFGELPSETLQRKM